MNFFRRLHEFALQNNQTITLLGFLTISSYMTYHLPAHIGASQFQNLKEVILRLTKSSGIGYLELLSVFFLLTITIFTVFLHLPRTMYQENILVFRHRRNYLEKQFKKLIDACQESQKIFAMDRSLENLHEINEFLIECMDRFRTDVERVVTPTLEELFSDAESFFDIEEDRL